ncbi:hypothetical protein Q9189_006044 [Teloschistes chrysophthalmus]
MALRYKKHLGGGVWQDVAVDGESLWGTHHQQVQHLQLPPSAQHGLAGASAAIGAISFDNQQELLWIGTQNGRVNSYYGPELQRYTSLQAHSREEGRVSQFLFHDRGIISVASRSVHMMNRRCLTQWHISCVVPPSEI